MMAAADPSETSGTQS